MRPPTARAATGICASIKASTTRLYIETRKPPPQFHCPDQFTIPQSRPFSCSIPRHKSDGDDATSKAQALNQKSLDKQEEGVHNQIDDAIGQARELQARTPWHREGSDQPPVARQRTAGAITKGKLLTTPSRLLKLILPLTTRDKNTDRKSIEPLALLVHPHQPLSYLERLIQSELPMIKGSDGSDKVPGVWFRAEDSVKDEIKADARDEDDVEEEQSEKEKGEEGSEEEMIDGKLVKVGKISAGKKKQADEFRKEIKSEAGGQDSKIHKIETSLRGGPGEGGVETYSGQGRETSSSKEQKFVRWSSSTEIGDFIRDAARGKEFAVEIEGAGKEIRVGVPSFNDRTHYLRVRLRKTSRKLSDMAGVKKECDELAHRNFTFRTSYGWDTMEPVTYLAGLSTIILGYLWFLYHNREVSYRAALNLTVSRRQNTLYTARGFDVGKWEAMIEEANALRKEIKGIAEEYDVDWDEKKDEGSEEVHDALLAERRKQEGNEEDEDDRKDRKEKEEKKKNSEEAG
ncbi:hypothetical protein QTJ16_000653 [Diplocarpon rosae]|uniref:Calcium uniporter protein, mitochondrial n=1 Tax=Diplocarpon rosae TaxID=946125 RepID=A0AAD9T6J9_9HELO|nr:hypothetical protein QTJ16_000653 [Diplocarpon rosae]